MVDYFGAETALNQLASVSVATGSQLVVSAYDKSSVGAIETAIIDANLGMTSFLKPRPLTRLSPRVTAPSLFLGPTATAR